jgi:hypothetical protein
LAIIDSEKPIPPPPFEKPDDLIEIFTSMEELNLQ